MKANNLQFFYNTTPTDCYGNNGNKKTYWVEHRLSSIKFRSTEDNGIKTLSEMTVKEFFKHLTKCRFGADTTIGKTIRNAIKLSLAQLVTTEFVNTLMEDKFYFYLDVDTSDVVIVKAKEVEHQNTIRHEAFVITRKEDKAGVSVYMSHGKQFNSISKDRKSMMIKTDFAKVETRGRKARKVEAVITKTSTLEENNAATVELKEKYNEAAEIINEQQTEFAEMKAKMAEFEKMKAELEQLKSIMYPHRKSIFSSDNKAHIDIDAPFNFEEIERI